MPQSRQLAAIMFTDIVGYTALMGNDEQHAFTLLNKNRQLQKPIIGAFDGRWIKELGDGTMASFNTVSDAVNAAIKIQEACNAANDFQLRIGIHQGEVVFENDDVFGDAVNIAARIEAAAKPGCIFISEAVNNNIANKKEIKTQFVKEEVLKNVSQPVKIYQVIFAGSEIIVPEIPAATVIENSIAVLPFANMSSDPEQEFFSDGISEEIINMLAQVPDLKVIARTSCFAFKGKNMDVKLIGEQLKVSHILEGSVRKSGNKLRITAQLIKVADGFHLYSEKFDRELDDIFAIQDEISEAILNAIKIQLLEGGKDGVFKKYTDNVEAYQLFLKGRYHFNKFSPNDFLKAIEYYLAAIDIDSSYAIAYAELAICYQDLAYFNWAPMEQNIRQAKTASEKAIQLDYRIAESHIVTGRIKMWIDYDFKEALRELEKGISINPNSVEGLRQLGVYYMVMENYPKANKYLQKAENLDPFSLINIFYIAGYHQWDGDTTKQIELGNRLLKMAPNFFAAHFVFGAVQFFKLDQYEKGIGNLELAAKMNGDMQSFSYLGTAYGLNGKKIKANEVLDKMNNLLAGQNQGNAFIGYVLASLGEWDKAYEYFNKAIDNHEGEVLLIKCKFKIYYPAMQNDPRTKVLLERIGLPN